LEITICQGDSVEINGAFYDQSGAYTDTIPNGSINGCDSIIVLQLFVNDTVIENIETIICEGDSFTVGNQIYSQSGNYM
jgi:hypothetical protein